MRDLGKKKKKKKRSINGLLFTHPPKDTTKTKARLFPHDEGRIESPRKNKPA